MDLDVSASGVIARRAGRDQLRGDLAAERSVTAQLRRDCDEHRAVSESRWSALFAAGDAHAKELHAVQIDLKCTQVERDALRAELAEMKLRVSTTVVEAAKAWHRARRDTILPNDSIGRPLFDAVDALAEKESDRG